MAPETVENSISGLPVSSFVSLVLELTFNNHNHTSSAGEILQAYSIPPDTIDIPRLEAADNPLVIAHILSPYLDETVMEASMGARLLSILLDQETPESERLHPLEEILDEISNELLVLRATLAGLDVENLRGAVRTKIQSIISIVGKIAAFYPKIDSEVQHAFVQDVMQVARPKHKTIEEGLVAQFTGFELVKPYIAKELLAFPVGAHAEWPTAMRGIQQRIVLISRFYDCIKDAIEFALEGESEVDHEQLATRLAKIGPLFVKAVQTFASVIPQSVKHIRDFLGTCTSLFQEGILPLSADEVEGALHASYGPQIPEGLVVDYEGPIGSASIAQVNKGTYEGAPVAVKIKRPGIEQAFDDNVMTFQILCEVFSAFLSEHVCDTRYGQIFSNLDRALPSVLTFLQKGFSKEFDLEQEREALERAQGVFEGFDSHRVPSPIEAASTKDVLVMELEPGIPIVEVSAHPNRLENLFVAGMQFAERNFWHGDPHPRNVKTDEAKGDLVLYDWGQHFEIPKGFMGEFLLLGLALARRSPRAIAKHFRALQDDPQKVTPEQILPLVKQLQELEKGLSLRGKALATIEFGESLTVLLAVHYQSFPKDILIHMVRSLVSVGSLFRDELNKPEYQGPVNKARHLFTSFLKAFIRVHVLGR